MNNYKACFLRYDHRGLRLSIFGKQVDEETMEIRYYTCNPHDVYKKKEARRMYEAGIAGTVVRIPLLSGDTVTYTFTRWMQQNSWKKVIGVDVNPWEIALSAKVVKPRITKLTKRHSRNYPHLEVTKLVRK